MAEMIKVRISPDDISPVPDGIEDYLRCLDEGDNSESDDDSLYDGIEIDNSVCDRFPYGEEYGESIDDDSEDDDSEDLYDEAVDIIDDIVSECLLDDSDGMSFDMRTENIMRGATNQRLKEIEEDVSKLKDFMEFRAKIEAAVCREYPEDSVRQLSVFGLRLKVYVYELYFNLPFSDPLFKEKSIGNDDFEPDPSGMNFMDLDDDDAVRRAIGLKLSKALLDASNMEEFTKFTVMIKAEVRRKYPTDPVMQKWTYHIRFFTYLYELMYSLPFSDPLLKKESTVNFKSDPFGADNQEVSQQDVSRGDPFGGDDQQDVYRGDPFGEDDQQQNASQGSSFDEEAGHYHLGEDGVWHRVGSKDMYYDDPYGEEIDTYRRN